MCRTELLPDAPLILTSCAVVNYMLRLHGSSVRTSSSSLRAGTAEVENLYENTLEIHGLQMWVICVSELLH